LDKVRWKSLCRNNFSQYFYNKEIVETKNKMSLVHFQINNFSYSIPPNVLSCSPKGGYGYFELIKKYS